MPLDAPVTTARGRCLISVMTDRYPETSGRSRCRAETDRVSDSVERVAARARTGRVRVVDREALLLDGVDEVDGGAGQVGRAHPVCDHMHAAVRGNDVAVHVPLVE